MLSLTRRLIHKVSLVGCPALSLLHHFQYLLVEAEMEFPA